MKPIKSKFRSVYEIGSNIITQASSSRNINNIRRNKSTFNQSRSTNYSLEYNKKKGKSPNEESKKIPEKISLKKNENTKLGIKKPLISISTPEREKIKKSETPRNAPLIPVNINPVSHLIMDNSYGIFENINWALGLRDYSKNEISKKKVNITETFNEPHFYVEDLEKYKNKNKNKNNYASKIVKLNPNFNKIKHMVLGGKTGNINFSQFNFSSCLRDYNKRDNKINIEKEKNWKMTPLPKIKSDKYIVKCLSPVTQLGRQNVKKLEKIMPKNYEINHGETYVGNDKILTKSLVNNRNYTVSGFGDCLGDPKYNNKFGDNNMFANKLILDTATNPLSKFELGLRIYNSYKNIKNFNRIHEVKNSE